MKRIGLFVALLFTVASTQAQSWTKVAGRWQYQFFKSDSAFVPPADTILSAPRASIAVVNDVAYLKTLTKWVKLFDLNSLSKSVGLHISADTLKFGAAKDNFGDSSAILYMKTRMIQNAIFNQFVISNTGYDSIPAVYQAAKGIQTTGYNPSQIILNRKYSEANNDTLNTAQYGGAITAYDEWRYDSASTRFKWNNKQLAIPTKGFNSTNRLYPPRDSVNVFTGNDGLQASSVYGEFGIGDSWGYNMHLYNNTLPTYPWAIIASKLDLMRNFDRGRLRKITGTGIAGYFANFKNYQGQITSSTFEEGNYHSKYFGFFAASEKDDNFTTATKAKVLRVGVVDTCVAFWAEPQRTITNSVDNGYAFVAVGDSDGSYMAGRQRIGGLFPTRKNGWLPYNLEVKGSSRTDTLFNFYQKFDSTGRITFASKNSSDYDAGGFSRSLIDGRVTVDSNGTGRTIPSVVFGYRNLTDYKTPTEGYNAIYDGRNYQNLSANRTATTGFCTQCPNMEFYGYHRVVLANSSKLSTAGGTLPDAIFFARNELDVSGGSNKKASGLGLTGFAGLFQLRSATIDSVGYAIQFKDYGAALNLVGRLGRYASFETDVTNYGNADSVFGFNQTQAGVRNRFAGNLELPALTSNTLVYIGANGALTSGQTVAQTSTVSTGAAAPATTPAKIGDMYVDTVNKKLYVATGTSSSSDWTILN